MAFQSSYNDVGGTSQTTSPKLQARDLPSKRLLGKGLASIGYETEWNEVRCARKDFIEVPSVIFEAEAAALVRLEGHENVVQTLVWTVDKMSCSLLLEYMDDDLLGLLQQRKESRRSPAGTESCTQQLPPFELQEALEIMLQTSRGMENLHEQGIPHGDLKTNNILVSQIKDGDKKTLSVKVADFGLFQSKRKSIPFVSRQVRKLDMVQWKAPEYLKRLSSHALEDNDETSSESDSDLHDECMSVSLKNDDGLLLQRCDVYSFAVSCSQILTGKKPYPNLNWKELWVKIVEGDLRPELPADCPPSLRDLLVQCWDKVPAKRPTFSIIRSKLDDLLASVMIDEQNPVGIFKSETVVAEQHADDIKKDVLMDPDVLMVDNSNVAESEYVLEAKHKVFLSYSGAQKDFVEQLCVDLERCDRFPFFDKLRSSLPMGKIFPKVIFNAIEQCQVGVVVLSEDFFMRSKWPMVELNAMVNEFEKPNSRLKIIPVFYLISDNDLKNPMNHYRWQSQWEEWARIDTFINVEKWRRAVRILGRIYGLVMKEGIGEVGFREEIVIQVCKLVPFERRWDDSHIQGRLRICKIILNKIGRDSSSEVPLVGLYGVGGIGKTTICKALCNYLCLQFHDKVCHIELGSASEMELLKKALMNLTNINHSSLDHIYDINQGFSYLRERLVTQPVFLALDDVRGDYKAMEIARAYLKASYGCGGVLLVTARSLDVLMKLKLDKRNCLEMPELEEDEAKSLFLNHVYLPIDSEIDEALIKQCIRRCYFLKGDGKSKHYHPLALKVLGQQIGIYNPVGWTEQLWKIDMFNQLEDKIHPVFYIFRDAFYSLRSKLQLVFMDLALILADDNGWTREWTSLDWLCTVHEEAIEDIKNDLEVLKRKSLLLDVSGDFAEIGMHDLWREFAVWETKAQDFTNQRWVYQVHGASDVLGRSGRFRDSVERMCFLNYGWEGLNGLNLADFVNVEAFKLDVKIYMADCALDLDLSGLKHLKSLHLNTPGLTVRADGLSALTNLRYLIWNTPGFSPCLDKIGHLRNLQFLALGDCEGVKVLDLAELRVLRVVVITEFPDLITVRGLSSRLAFIRCLRINGCKSLQECPGVGELYALKELNLQKCGKLGELPWLGRLTELRMLHIYGCKSITTVPGLGDLVALEYLDVMKCRKLAMLPDLEKLSKLRVLHLESNLEEESCLDGVISLTTLSKLSVLKTIDIRGWNGPIWTSIGSLLMLESLRFIDCKGEDVVPDLKNLESLKSVVLFGCEVMDLSGLSNSTSLKTLRLGDCDKLEILPEFEGLSELTDLRITGCENLRNSLSGSDVCSLNTLQVDGASGMGAVQDLETLTGLRKLMLCGRECELVLGMASLIFQLETLEINSCSTMEAVDVSNFSQLKELWLMDCNALKRVTCGRPLTELAELRVYYCESLVEMPDLSTFPLLEEIRLEKCSAVRRLSCSGALTALRKFKLIGSDREVEMPDLSWFPNLNEFRVENDASSDDDEDDSNDGEDDDNDDTGESGKQFKTYRF